MTLTPATNIAPATVVIGGTVDVSDRAARLVGHVAVDSMPAGAIAVTGPLTDAQLRASAVPISAAALPLPTGAAQDSTLTNGTQRVGGTVVVDGSGVTQPISAASLPLPTGAAKDSTLTDGTQRVGGSVSVNVGNFPADQLVHFTTPIAVTGPLTDAQLRATAVPISAAALPLPAGAATEATLATLATAAGQAAITAALAGLSTEETLAAVNEAINDVALTAILEREKVGA